MIKILLLTAFTLATSALGQSPNGPQVDRDDRVTFRLKAANATNVQLRCEGVPGANLLKDAMGVWSFTTPPLEPDIYAYSFVVDGLRIIDPGNPLLKANLLNTESEVHVPGPKSLPWEINDVPHGLTHRHLYKSAVADDERDFVVYTPPGYDPSARKRYPVLYLLHGFSDDARAWSTSGRANIILDNLIARGQAKPMIVVMPLGYGVMDYVWTSLQSPRSYELRWLSIRKFREMMSMEIMPQVEQAYRVKSDRESRAIAGLSMGGAESLFIGLNEPEQFAWIGAFSAGGLTNFSEAFPQIDAGEKLQLRLLWMACGTEDQRLDNNHRLNQWLKSKGVENTWVETPGMHDFRAWRRHLAQFLPQLFQARK